MVSPLCISLHTLDCNVSFTKGKYLFNLYRWTWKGYELQIPDVTNNDPTDCANVCTFPPSISTLPMLFIR